MRKSSLILIAIVVAATVLGVFFIHPDYWGSTTRPWRLGLDLVGGTHLVYEIDMNGVDSADRGAVLDGIRDRIETRVNSSGVREPQVVTAKQGDSYRLIVDIAGIKDTSAAIAQIGETPFLVFAEESSKSFPVKAKTADGKEIEVQGNQPGFTPTTLTGRYVKSAQLNFNNVTRQPEVFLEFDADGAKLFEDITAKNVGKQLAIFVDNELLTAPRVNERITGGRAQITGQFTVTEAQRLVARFKDGALAAPIRLVSQQTIGATLGSDSLQKTLWAGLVGAVVVMLFMIVYYHTLGLKADATEFLGKVVSEGDAKAEIGPILKRSVRFKARKPDATVHDSEPSSVSPSAQTNVPERMMTFNNLDAALNGSDASFPLKNRFQKGGITFQLTLIGKWNGFYLLKYSLTNEEMREFFIASVQLATGGALVPSESFVPFSCLPHTSIMGTRRGT
jgi:preprotein translocase subunit SecD